MRVGRVFIFAPAPSWREKKLMARVRPGVEEVWASFEPRSALMRELFPTFERPRKATSGALWVFASVGKCDGFVAERRKTGVRRIV